MEPASLELQAFGAGDELDALGETRQVKYARRYLTGLGATSTLVEPHYFDRDYLAEHSAFYSLSTRGYPNHCRRLHFFKGEPLTRKRLESVAAGDAKACTELQDDYLGFIVVRPIVSAPFGRTVLKWWDDGAPMTPRVTHPCLDEASEDLEIDALLVVDSVMSEKKGSEVRLCTVAGEVKDRPVALAKQLAQLSSQSGLCCLRVGEQRHCVAERLLLQHCSDSFRIVHAAA